MKQYRIAYKVEHVHFNKLFNKLRKHFSIKMMRKYYNLKIRN